MREDWMRDISGLGGLPLYLVVQGGAVALSIRPLAEDLAVVLVLSYAVTWPLRLIWFRPRPVPQTHGSVLQRIDASSFPSLHAVRGTAFWTLIAAITWNPGVMVICALNVALIAWTRTWLKRHHASDVAVGVVLGLLVVWFVLWYQEVWTTLGDAVGL